MRRTARQRWRRSRHFLRLFLFQSLFACFRLLIAGVNLQTLFRLSHCILSVVFGLVDIGAIVQVADIIWFEFEHLGVIGQGFVVIVHLHFDRGTLLVNPRVVRLDLDRLSVVLDGFLKHLVLCQCVPALLIDGGEVRRVFVVEIGSFAKQIHGFVPVLALGSVCAFAGELVRFLRVFAALSLAHL